MAGEGARGYPLLLRHAEAPSARGRARSGSASARLGLFACWMEDYDTARRELERAVAVARDAGSSATCRCALSALAELEFRVGNWSAARAHAEEALRLADDADQFLHFGHIVLLVLDAVTGDADGARAYADIVSTIAARSGSRSLAMYATRRPRAARARARPPGGRDRPPARARASSPSGADRRAQLRALDARPDREPDPRRAGARGARHAGRVRGPGASGPAVLGARRRRALPRPARPAARPSTRSSPRRTAGRRSLAVRARPDRAVLGRAAAARRPPRRRARGTCTRRTARSRRSARCRGPRRPRASCAPAAAARSAARGRAPRELTAQQAQIATMVAEGQTNKSDRDLAVPQPEDDRVPPRPRLSQARGEQPHPARRARCLRTRDSPGASGARAGRESALHAQTARCWSPSPCSGSASPPPPAPPTCRRTSSRPNVNDPGIDPSRGAQPRLARARPGPAGREAAGVPAAAEARPTSRRTGSRSGSEGGRLGYHTIVLAYRNEAPIQTLPPDGCGTSVDPPRVAAELRDRRAHGDPRRQGRIDRSSTSIAANSIENRLTKALAVPADDLPEPRAGRSSSTPRTSRSGRRS